MSCRRRPVSRTTLIQPTLLRKPAILIVGPKPPPYHGVSVVTEMILNSELQEKFKIIHIDTSDHRALQNIGKLDPRNIYLAFSHIFILLFSLIKYSPRIVYFPICQTTMGYLRDTFLIVLSKFFGARVIIHLHGGYFRTLYEKGNIFTKFIIEYSLNLVNKSIVLGKSLRHIFDDLVPSERIAVVANGIDRNYITESELQQTNSIRLNPTQNPSVSTSSKKMRVLFLSNLTLSKGYYDVIKATPEVLKHYKKVEFIFAGQFWNSQKKKEEIEKFIIEHELDAFVNFAGRVVGKAKKELLLSCGIFVLPTYYAFEGQPLVILEAMAAGLPIITTDQGCIKEMVIDCENGFIIEKKNPEKIAEKIIYLLKNENVRRKMGKKSRERFLKYYTKDRFIDGLSRVFDEVLAET